MPDVMEVKQLNKTFDQKRVLQDVSFSVKRGSCFGLLGPNGAGKSTTMKILCGIVEADSGSVLLDHLNVLENRNDMKKRLGYVPQEITLFEQLTAYQNLVCFGEFYGLKGAELKKRISYVLEQVGLADQSSAVIKTFSGGMKRRINMAAALLHQPELLILDEPTVGIDPQSRNHIFELIRSLTEQGITIIYSTHYMEEVQALCDDLAIIDHGKIIDQGSLEYFYHHYGKNAIYLELEEHIPLPAFAAAAEAKPQGKGWLLESTENRQTMKDIVRWLHQEEIAVVSLEVFKPSLEHIFLTLTGTDLRN